MCEIERKYHFNTSAKFYFSATFVHTNRILIEGETKTLFNVSDRNQNIPYVNRHEIPKRIKTNINIT